MKLNKKYIKNLSRDKKSNPLEQTNNVAGGTHSGENNNTVECNSDACRSNPLACIPIKVTDTCHLTQSACYVTA